MKTDTWQKIQEGLFLYRDSCHVYAVQGPQGTVLINAGTGLAAEHLAEVAQNGPVIVLLTHHFRDHCDGAIRLHEAGAQIIGPYWDREYLLDPEQHFRERQIWNSYDNRWDRFSPVRPIPVTDWLMDYETREIAGLPWQVIPTPGVTNGASSYLVTLNGHRLAFVGEVICGHGRTSRLAPLQYNYNDLNGAVNLWHSCSRIIEAEPNMLLPSLGEPMDDPAGAIQAFKDNLARVGEIVREVADKLIEPDEDDIEEILPHLYRSKYASACTHFVISDSGKVMSLDYGYNTSAYVPPIKQHLSNRRPLLHGLKGLKKRFSIDRIDTVLVTHFHDDHVNGIPMLQRLFGAEVWAGKHFSDILERPTHYDRPCLWHEPIPVSRHLASRQTVHWENIPITLYPMSGHTRFATLVCMEIDGQRVAHTGDQVFFQGKDSYVFESGAKLIPNHVYKNGLDIGCYKQTLEDLRRFRPQWILTGHTVPYQTSEQWYDAIERGANAFDEVHQRLMALGDDEVHFGAESQGGKLKPYQLHLPDGGTGQFEGWILNPFASEQTATARLIAPEGWHSLAIEVALGPRQKKNIQIAVTVPAGTRCRRQPVALDLVVGGRPFGQVTEALVTAGYPRL